MWRNSHALNSNFRRYASTSRFFKGKGPPLSLEHFVQRQKALHLWRDINRAINKIQSPTTQAETRRFARDEFELNKNVQDISHIRYLISTGKTQFDAMRRYIDEQAM